MINLTLSPSIEEERIDIGTPSSVELSDGLVAFVNADKEFICAVESYDQLTNSLETLQTIKDNLEKHGLVERVQDKQDRRFLKIHLTTQGFDLISRVFPRHATIAEEVFAILSNDEQEQLGRLLKKLGRSEINTKQKFEKPPLRTENNLYRPNGHNENRH